MPLPKHHNKNGFGMGWNGQHPGRGIEEGDSLAKIPWWRSETTSKAWQPCLNQSMFHSYIPARSKWSWDSGHGPNTWVGPKRQDISTIGGSGDDDLLAWLFGNDRHGIKSWLGELLSKGKFWYPPKGYPSSCSPKHDHILPYTTVTRYMTHIYIYIYISGTCSYLRYSPEGT